MAEEVNTLFEQLLQEGDLLQKAKLLLVLKKEKDVPVGEISRRMQKKPSYVSHILRLNKLPELVVDGYYSKTISPTHLFVISRLKTHEEMIKAYEEVLSKNLTVLDTDIYVRKILYGVEEKGEHLKDEELKEFEKEMEGKGMSAKVVQSHIKGKVTLEMKGNLEKTSRWLREVMCLCKELAPQRVEPSKDF